jgi:hypothetical protein
MVLRSLSRKSKFCVACLANQRENMELEAYDELKEKLDNLASWLKWNEFKELYEDKVSGNATLARRVIVEYGHGGYTRLHYHLRYKPPVEVVRVIVSSYPEAVLIQDHFGDTPLHCAINKNASVYVLRCLIQAQEQIVTPHPNVLHCQNNNGDTALHRATSTLNMQVLDLLIQGDQTKRALLINNGRGQSALQLAIRQPEESYDSVEQADGSLSPVIGYMLEQTSLALEIASKGDNVESGNRMAATSFLRKLLDCAPQLCPSAAAKLIQVVTRDRSYTEDEVLREQESGDTYFHSLIRAKWRNPCLCGPALINNQARDSAASSERAGENDRARPIRLLVQQYPRGAAQVNARGELPLHVALKGGHSWSTGVEVLYEAFLEAARQRDVVTQQYPFVLALLGKEASCLTSVYVLLRDCVSQITFTPLETPLAKGKRKRDADGSSEEEGAKRVASGK